jgi:hypothetical protein
LLSQELFLTATAATFVEAWRIVGKMAALAASLNEDKALADDVTISHEYTRLLGQVM